MGIEFDPKSYEPGAPVTLKSLQALQDLLLALLPKNIKLATFVFEAVAGRWWPPRGNTLRERMLLMDAAHVHLASGAVLLAEVAAEAMETDLLWVTSGETLGEAISRAVLDPDLLAGSRVVVEAAPTLEIPCEPRLPITMVEARRLLEAIEWCEQEGQAMSLPEDGALWEQVTVDTVHPERGMFRAGQTMPNDSNLQAMNARHDELREKLKAFAGVTDDDDDDGGAT